MNCQSIIKSLQRALRPLPARGAEPAGRATAAPALEGDRLALSPAVAATAVRLGEVWIVPGCDALLIQVKPGDTLWRLASKWGAPGGTAEYVEAIRGANGLRGDTIRAGQTLLLPYAESSAGLQLLVGLALQKDLRGTEALDMTSLKVEHGPLDSYVATVRTGDGKAERRFALFDDATGDDPYRWVVEPLEPAGK